MNVTRQDAWSKDEDVILAETVLRYIRDGKTQLEAFNEVAKKLSRTSAACGFRWNATIRRQYDNAVLEAKQDRKSGLLDKHHSGMSTATEPNTDPIEAAIMLLKKMKHGTGRQFSHELTEDEAHILVYQLQRENELLKEHLNRYDEAWKEMGKLWEWVRSDKPE